MSKVITATSIEGLTPPSTVLRNAPKAGLVYGPSDTGKTSQMGFMAKYIWKKYHKRTRLVSADGGGWAPLQSYIDLGIIEPVSVLGSPHPGEMLKFLMEGHWPFNKEGKPVEMGTKASEPTSATWDDIGGYGFEGLYSIATLLMQFHSSNQSLEQMAGGAMSKNQQTSKIVDGKDSWTQPGIAFYNYALQKMGKYVFQSSALPVHKVLWTSLIDCYEKKDNTPDHNIIEAGPYGPAMIGKAGIKVIPQWFGDLIHVDIVHSAVEQEDRPDRKAAAAKVGTVTKIVRAYLKSHTHPKDGLLVPAKPRVDPSQYHLVPNFHDFTASEGFIDWLYELEDKLAEDGTAALKLELGL